MLTRNVDVSDGLVNGAPGAVIGFVEYRPARSLPAAVLVEFDHDRVGACTQQSTSFNLTQFPKAVPITVIEAKFTISGKKSGMEISRQQFPLRLCWATTIHKVQGLTVNQIVVSMQGKMSDGQVYVAFSHVPSLSGLVLLDFDVKKLRASSKVTKELDRMQRTSQLETVQDKIQTSLDSTPGCLLFAVHNIRSLPAHHRDLVLQPLLMSCVALCLTETWLTSSHSSGTFAIPNYTLLREDSQRSPGGGVCTYVSNTTPFHVENLSLSEKGVEIQYVVLHLPQNSQLFLATVYRHPTLSLKKFELIISKLIHCLGASKTPTIIVGDFNINLMQDNLSLSVLNELLQYGFTQHVENATHRSGSLLDHVYCNRDVTVHQTGTYYSDHDMLWLSIPL